MEICFPSGVVVRAAGLADRDKNADWREFGLYMDSRWDPNWPSRMIEWPDFGVPTRDVDAARSIEEAYGAALTGCHVEVGCAGGLGRTGTVLACMAVLSGVNADEAVSWVRANYDSRAVETVDQEYWVEWFAHQVERH